MSIVVMVDTPGMTAELYDAVSEKQGLGARLPEGCLAHIAGPGPEGWRVVAVWESLEGLQQFMQTSVRPIQAELGVVPPTKPPATWELYKLVM